MRILSEVRDPMLDREEDGLDIHGHHRVPLLFGHFMQSHGRAVEGTVDNDLQATEMLDGLLD